MSVKRTLRIFELPPGAPGQEHPRAAATIPLTSRTHAEAREEARRALASRGRLLSLSFTLDGSLVAVVERPAALEPHKSGAH